MAPLVSRLISASAAFLTVGSHSTVALESCSEGCPKTRRLQGLTLVQINQARKSQEVLQKKHAIVKQRITLSQSADEALARQIRNNFLDSGNLGQSLNGGLEAIVKALPGLMENLGPLTSGQVGDSFLAGGEDLLKVIMSLVQDGEDAGEFTKFEDAFLKIFEDLPSTLPQLTETVNSFRETGKSESLVKALDMLFEHLDVEILDILPAGSGLEIANYIGALKDVFDALGDGSEEIELGNMEGGLKEIFNGLRTAANDFGLGVNDTALDNIMSQLDPIFGSFFSTISDFQKQLEGSTVCWKGLDAVERQRIRPAQCPADHTYDGQHWCVPANSSASSLLSWLPPAQTCQGTSDCQYVGCDQPDHVICYHGICYTGTQDERCRGRPDMYDLGDAGWCYEGRRDIFCPVQAAPGSPTSTPSPSTSPKTIAPECDKDGDFPHQLGAWCFKPCPSGTKPSENGHLCEPACVGQYPYSDPFAPLLCGKTQAAVQRAVKHMISQSLQGALGMFAGGFSMPSTLTSLANVGKGFIHPQCPIGSQ